MATYFDLILRKVQPFGLNRDDVEDICGEAGLDISEEADYQKANLAIWQTFDTFLKYTISNISEGGMSQSWNIEAIKLYYNQLCYKLGKDNALSPTPRIKNKSHIW